MDDIDIGCEQEQQDRDRCIAVARRIASEIPVGNPGECDLCGEWSGRLVCAVCAPCRDKHKGVLI